ncbi:MAG: hypothetical protein M1834_000196 [Cirrosporium novae-zelandiae]|nr:MAG: hypothetical protein M1834_000196 [Cirrosporium novae-zelandiae]
MAATQNGYLNGNSQSLTPEITSETPRFSDIPSAIDIPVGGTDTDEAVEIDLEQLQDDPTELCTVLENEGAAKHLWLLFALAYAKQGKIDHAIEIIQKGLSAMSRASPKEKLGLLSCLCWMYLWKAREAPRMIPEGQLVSEARNKEYYLQAATTTLNEATRANPAFPPLYLARGVLSLLRASLQPPSKTLTPGTADERIETLRQALKSFNDALKVSGGRNMMAVLGRARTQFSLGNYADALDGYQEVLAKLPRWTDPDPRIGIGCCLWQLGYKDEAKVAWERALEMDPNSKIPIILLSLFYLHDSNRHPPNDPMFASTYKKAMTEYTQKAYKLDKELPLTCATFGHYFLPRKAFPTVETLARKAIEYTDVNAIASDGWYLLARKEHYEENFSRAADYYNRAEMARGGAEKGYFPAKFGMAQMQVKVGDRDGAKYRLEKMIHQQKSPEAMSLLGTLYAEEIFAVRTSGSKEDKSTELKKAIGLLETVRMQWKDPKKHLSPDESLLLCLARLYEIDQPDKSMQCLQQVEQMQLDQIKKDIHPEDLEDESTAEALLRENLLPQLLNNIACFQYQADKNEIARDSFQTALNACIKLGEKDEAMDTDALVTTTSYNLARTYEAAGLLDEAKKVYGGLLERHSDYTDANARLTYIALRQSPSDEGPKSLAKLYETESADLEVRALFGWYLSRAKKRTQNIAEDQEQRHYKHTLQHYDKHDRYSLTGMGNLYLTTAREMRRESGEDKEKRRKTYERAVEFLDKALQLDSKNAYAAQGIGIALADDKKDFRTALQVFTQIRDTLRDSSVNINLGHVYTELKQWSRAIENYEAALAKDRAGDPNVLACLGRVWLQRGKSEQQIDAMKNALEYSNRALELAPEGIHFKFNVAFVQIQLAQLIYTLPEAKRTLGEVQDAAKGLEQAIESFLEIAQSPNPPYHKHDLEQRANMGRNTMRKQLDRAIQAQKEYEQKNADKLQAARQAREAEMQKREEARKRKEEKELEHKKKLKEERQVDLEKARQVAEKVREEEKAKDEAEWSMDDETGEKVKKARKRKGASGGKRKKKGDESDVEGSIGRSTRENTALATDEEDSRPAPKKKRRLERKVKSTGKQYKSQEIIVDSDEEDEDSGVQPTSQASPQANGNGRAQSAAGDDGDTPMRDVEDERGEDVVRRDRKKNYVLDDDDDEDEDEDEGSAPPTKPTEIEEDGSHSSNDKTNGTADNSDHELDAAAAKDAADAVMDDAPSTPAADESAAAIGDQNGGT